VRINPSTFLCRAWSTTPGVIGISLLCLFLAPLVSTAQNTISTYAGGTNFGTTATTIDLPGPSGVIRDGAGNTYIAAPYSTYVFKLTGNTISSFSGLGYGTYSGDGGPASSAGLGLPTSLAIDGTGNIYIVDSHNSRIRKVSATTGQISTAAGSGTKCEPSTATCGDGGPATLHNVAALNLPSAVAVDAQGILYIADSADHRIRAVNQTGGTVTVAGVKIGAGDIQTIAGNGSLCSSTIGNCGDGGAATAAQLNFPEGVAVDSNGNIYISDTRDNRIREIAKGANGGGGSIITTFVGSGIACFPSTGTCGDGKTLVTTQLHYPMGLALDPSNNLYIADSADQKVRLVNVLTSNLSTVAGDGAQGFIGDNGAATLARLNMPSAVFLDNSANLLIADSGNQRVRIVSNGTILTLAGGGTGGDGLPATNATFAGPYTVSEDSSGNLYIADTANNRIRTVDAQTLQVSTVVGTGLAGYTGDGGPATSATLNAPTAVVVDSSDNIWIADTGNNVIREVPATGNMQAGNITTVAGNGSSCLAIPPPDCGDGDPATSAGFGMPLGIAVDSSGNLFISDYTAQRVREVSAAPPHNISTVAGDGQRGNRGDGGLATAAHMDFPKGIVVDSSNTVYVSDTQNNRVRSFQVGGNINAYALNGAAHLQGDGGPKLLGGQWNPLDLGIDPSGNVYIASGNDNVVRRVDSVSGTIGTVAGFLPKGIGGFGGDGGPATLAHLDNEGLTVDAQSNLFIADAGNNRIRKVHLTPAGTATPAALNFSATPLHQSSPPQTVTLKSSGGVDLKLTGISFGGKNPTEFSETDNCVTLVNLGVDVTCTVTVTFTPLSYALRSATMTLNDNDFNGPETVALSGYGPYFTPSVAPSALTISPGSTGTATVTVTPFGNFDGLIALSCSGAPPNSTWALTPTQVNLDGTDTAKTSALTLTTTSTTPAGVYSLTITGVFTTNGGHLQYSTTLQVTIT